MTHVLIILLKKYFRFIYEESGKNKKSVGATDNNNKDIAQKTRNCLTFLRLLQIGVKNDVPQQKSKNSAG